MCEQQSGTILQYSILLVVRYSILQLSSVEWASVEKDPSAAEQVTSTRVEKIKAYYILNHRFSNRDTQRCSKG